MVTCEILKHTFIWYFDSLIFNYLKCLGSGSQWIRKSYKLGALLKTEFWTMPDNLYAKTWWPISYQTRFHEEYIQFKYIITQIKKLEIEKIDGLSMTAKTLILRLEYLWIWLYFYISQAFISWWNLFLWSFIENV